MKFSALALVASAAIVSAHKYDHPKEEHPVHTATYGYNTTLTATPTKTVYPPHSTVTIPGEDECGPIKTVTTWVNKPHKPKPTGDYQHDDDYKGGDKEHHDDGYKGGDKEHHDDGYKGGDKEHHDDGYKGGDKEHHDDGEKQQEDGEKHYDDGEKEHHDGEKEYDNGEEHHDGEEHYDGDDGEQVQPPAGTPTGPETVPTAGAVAHGASGALVAAGLLAAAFF